jgi:hypothetical protein
MKLPIDCHQCEHGLDKLEEFDKICEYTNNSVLDCTDKRHCDCPLNKI